jgi:hypothetical protein
MLSRYSVVLLMVGLWLSSFSVAADDLDKRHELDALLAKANAAKLRSSGSPAFHLRLQLHAEHITAKPIDGTYDERCYLQTRPTIHATPAQKLTLATIDRASPEIAPQLI